MFRAGWTQIIQLRHELVQLAGKIDLEFIDGEMRRLYSGPVTAEFLLRHSLVIACLLFLKICLRMSAKAVCERGSMINTSALHRQEFSRQEFPHERSELSIGESAFGRQAEILLREIAVAHESGDGKTPPTPTHPNPPLRTKDWRGAQVDTTVQPRTSTSNRCEGFCTPRSRGLPRLARKSRAYGAAMSFRIAKRACHAGRRYDHAKQFNRHP